MLVVGGVKIRRVLGWWSLGTTLVFGQWVHFAVALAPSSYRLSRKLWRVEWSGGGLGSDDRLGPLGGRDQLRLGRRLGLFVCLFVFFNYSSRNHCLDSYKNFKPSQLANGGQLVCRYPR